jgi:hypothetical protein
MFDVEARDFRHRELFETPAEEHKYFPPDRRRELADAFIAENKVEITSCIAEENKKTRAFVNPATGAKDIIREIVYRDWRVVGDVAGEKPVEIVINDTGRIIFGRCSCAYFAEHLLNQGPCEHMLALFKVSDDARVDQPSSTAVERPEQSAPRREPRAYEVDQSVEDTAV